MSSLISASESSGILAVISSSFDTWSRLITVYKEPIKVEVTPSPVSAGNLFGFGEIQQEPIYTYLPPVTGVFYAIIRDGDIPHTESQSKKTQLAPEIQTRIIASPISIKVKRDAFLFIEEGETTKIVDNMSEEVYILDGHGCLQTFQGSEYYVYPLRKTL